MLLWPQYTDAEYRDKVGWGHSSIDYAVDVALAAGVERLVLFHHDPAHDDAMMERMEAMARAHVGRRGQAPDVRAALSRGPELLPDIAIIDRELLDGDGDAVLDVLRDRLGRRNFPIIVLADSSIPSDAVYRGEASWTDYLPKPFSPPMLRTRVRAWLARTLLVFDPVERVALRGERVTGSED